MFPNNQLLIWIQFAENKISQGIYFFVPLALIISVNGVFFILTALKIRQVQKSVKTITERGDSHRHQSSLAAEKNKYVIGRLCDFLVWLCFAHFYRIYFCTQNFLLQL